MSLVSIWTGRHASALQKALLLSNERFAKRLEISTGAVARWHNNPDITPQSAVQQALDKVLEKASPVEKSRFAELTGEPAESLESPPTRDPEIAEAEQRLLSHPPTASILEWLDTSAAWEPGTSRRKLAERLIRLGVGELEDRGARRGRINQREIAQSLAEYYGDRSDGYGLYLARYGADEAATTSLLTRPDWLDLECRLSSIHDRLDLTSGVVDKNVALDKLTAEAAVQRLAETLTLNYRLVDSPLYWLKAINIYKGVLAGSLGLVPFVRYALTMDLLEGELIDALAAGRATRRGALPLRDSLLPDLASVIGVSDRLCSGGALALTAIARPASGNRPADYVMLVQERSGRVLNAARRLAVIPKGFHEPLVDFRVDAQIGSTLQREMEEELFGREDVDSTTMQLLTTDPMHPSRLSEDTPPRQTSTPAFMINRHRRRSPCQWGRMVGMAAPPESTKNSLHYRLVAHARTRWPQITSLEVRYRGQFAYAQAHLTDGTIQPLIRLRYGGSARHWGFGLYLASSDRYEDQILPSGLPIGSPEEALDCACGLYLDNPA